MRVLAEIGAGGVNGPSVCDTSLASVTDRGTGGTDTVFSSSCPS